MPRGCVPRKIDLVTVGVLDQEYIQQLNHLGGILLLGVEVRDLIGGQLQGGGQDQAPLGSLPLGNDSHHPGRYERAAALHLDRERTILIDGKESLVGTEGREDGLDSLQLLLIFWIVARKHFSSILPVVTSVSHDRSYNFQ